MGWVDPEDPLLHNPEDQPTPPPPPPLDIGLALSDLKMTRKSAILILVQRQVPLSTISRVIYVCMSGRIHIKK